MATSSNWPVEIENAAAQDTSTLPHCGDPDCTFVRRLWRKMRWWNASIKLQGRCYCAPQCFENAARACFAAARLRTASVQPIRHRMPLGLLLLSRGEVTNRQLRSALEAQQANGRYRIGEWLEKLGFVNEQQVTAALGLQWACPVLASSAAADTTCASMLPYRFLEDFRMLPVQFVAATRTFYIAFCDGIDYVALRAIGQMLDCRTEACLVSGSVYQRSLEEIRREFASDDLLFSGWRSPVEMSRTTCGYVLKLGAEDVRIVNCGTYIWARLRSGRDVANLLFRQDSALVDGARTRLNFA